MDGRTDGRCKLSEYIEDSGYDSFCARPCVCVCVCARVCVLVTHGRRNYFSVWQMALDVGCDVYILSFWIFIWRLPLMEQKTSVNLLFCTSAQRRLFMFPTTTFVVNSPLRCWKTNAVGKMSLTSWKTKYSDYHLANMQAGALSVIVKPR